MTLRISRFLPSLSVTAIHELAPLLRAFDPGFNGPISHTVNRDALREPGKTGGIYGAMHAHPVATLQGIRRQFEISRQAAIVGEQQQAFAVQVQPADADHARKVWWQMGKDGRTPFFVARGGHQADGLVIQEQARRFRGRQRSAVHDDLVGWPNGEGR